MTPHYSDEWLTIYGGDDEEMCPACQHAIALHARKDGEPGCEEQSSFIVLECGCDRVFA